RRHPFRVPSHGSGRHRSCRGSRSASGGFGPRKRRVRPWRTLSVRPRSRRIPVRNLVREVRILGWGRPASAGTRTRSNPDERWPGSGAEHLMKDLGLDVHWYVLSGTNPFFDATKAIHNALQGAPAGLTPEMESAYRKVNEANAADFHDDFDVVVIHDPQPAPLVNLVKHKSPWIWRCHIDLTTPNRSVLRLLQPYLEKYDAAIFSAASYAPAEVRFRKLVVAPPAIDPLSPKNRDVSESEWKAILSRFEFDPTRPVISQVGRFDPWKDPLGVIDAYRLVKRSLPEVQLLMIGSMAKDDPEGWLWFERTARHAGDDPDIHFLTHLRGVGALEVNVLQRETDVALAKSLREGSGLIV